MLNLEELNALDRSAFVECLGPVFEHSPWIAERAWQARPFASRDALQGALCDVVHRASEEEKLSLICAHPDLVGNAVLTAESQQEQTSAGLGTLTAEETEQFRDFNERYRTRFGFPFVICARLNKKQAILRAFPERLENAPAAEIETALDEIYKIANLRLQDCVR